jgi:hypothetical protein
VAQVEATFPDNILFRGRLERVERFFFRRVPFSYYRPLPHEVTGKKNQVQHDCYNEFSYHGLKYLFDILIVQVGNLAFVRGKMVLQHVVQEVEQGHFVFADYLYNFGNPLVMLFTDISRLTVAGCKGRFAHEQRLVILRLTFFSRGDFAASEYYYFFHFLCFLMGD